MQSPSTMRSRPGWLERLVRANNRIVRWRRVRVSDPAGLLLLVPHCLQHGACGRNLLRADGAGCARCGRCAVDGVLALSDRYGVPCLVAGGGRQAVRRVRAREIRAVVAVACPRELAQGIAGAFPRPVLAVCNRRPLGDCHDTQVDLAEVEAAIRELLGLAPMPPCNAAAAGSTAPVP